MFARIDIEKLWGTAVSSSLSCRADTNPTRVCVPSRSYCHRATLPPYHPISLSLFPFPFSFPLAAATAATAAAFVYMWWCGGGVVNYTTPSPHPKLLVSGTANTRAHSYRVRRRMSIFPLYMIGDVCSNGTYIYALYIVCGHNLLYIVFILLFDYTFGLFLFNRAIAFLHKIFYSSFLLIDLNQ